MATWRAPGWTCLLLGIALGFAGINTSRAATDACPSFLSAAIPERPADAPGGSAFVRQTAGLSEAAREEAIGAELLAGNIPHFLRNLRPVTLERRLADGRPVRVTLCVTPDYLALGSDRDFVRIPMGRQTAFLLADRFGFVLPTPRMVDAIYRQADVRLAPQPMPPSEQMRSNAYFRSHQERIHAQRLAAGAPLGALIGGQKKDLVLTERLRRMPDRVAIYGWHRRPGDPIQPLSTLHGARYADYSHGVRLVSVVAKVDGRRRSIFELLEDPELAPVVSGEGAIPQARRLVLALEGRQQLARLPASGSDTRACASVC